MLLFDLIDQDSNGIVSIENISGFLNLSYIQNFESDIQNTNVLREVFENQTQLNKKNTLDVFIHNNKAKELLQAYLQIKNLNTNLGLTSADE